MTIIPWDLGKGGSRLNDQLKVILNSLADDDLLGHVKVTQTTGAAADTDIAVTGLKSEDTLICAFASLAGGFTVIPTDGISHGSGDGYCQLNVDTSDSTVWVLWVDKSAKGTQKAS